jgi:hypothetical protein
MSANRFFTVDHITSTQRKRHNGEIDLREFKRNTTNQRAQYEARLEIASDIINNTHDDEPELLALAKVDTTTKTVDAVTSGLQSELHNLAKTVKHVKTVSHQLDRGGSIALDMGGRRHRLLSSLQLVNDAIEKLHGQTQDREKELLRLEVGHLQQKIESLEVDHKTAKELLSGARKEGLSSREPTHDFGATILEVHHVMQTLTTQRDDLQTQLQSCNDEIQAAEKQTNELKENERNLEAEVQNLRMQAGQQTDKHHQFSDMQQLAVRRGSERDILKKEMVRREKEQKSKDAASDKRLQQIFNGHQKTLGKLMDENKALRSDKQTLRREIKDAKNSQAFAEAQVTEARNKIADVRRANTARAVQAYPKRKKEDGHRVPGLLFETQGGGAAADQSSGANRRPRNRSK